MSGQVLHLPWATARDIAPTCANIDLANDHVRLAEDHEQVARAGLLEQRLTHRQIGTHARGKDGELAAAFHFFRDVRVEREAADDEQIEAEPQHRFLGRVFDQVAADGAVLGADADGDALRAGAQARPYLGVLAGRVEPGARVGFQPIELETLVAHRVLHAGRVQILDDHGLELPVGGLPARRFLGGGPLFVHGEDAVRREAFHAERAGHQYLNNYALQMVRRCQYDLLSKLAVNAALFFLYDGLYSGRGPHKQYGAKVNYAQLPARYLKQTTTEQGICTAIYQCSTLHKLFAQTLNVVTPALRRRRKCHRQDEHRDRRPRPCQLVQQRSQPDL